MLRQHAFDPSHHGRRSVMQQGDLHALPHARRTPAPPRIHQPDLRFVLRTAVEAGVSVTVLSQP